MSGSSLAAFPFLDAAVVPPDDALKSLRRRFVHDAQSRARQAMIKRVFGGLRCAHDQRLVVYLDAVHLVAYGILQLALRSFCACVRRCRSSRRWGTCSSCGDCAHSLPDKRSGSDSEARRRCSMRRCDQSAAGKQSGDGRAGLPLPRRLCLHEPYHSILHCCSWHTLKRCECHGQRQLSRPAHLLVVRVHHERARGGVYRRITNRRWR
mmetsp:Transcript_34752/g.81424  ORF Transcript_34752/g.81424 Transcript_34752/m.81424 type:complete len:208 (-) Transcript_34752:56-679(-)